MLAQVARELPLLRRAAPPLGLAPATDDARVAEGWLERFEGVVAKQRELRYQPGRRAMIKVKREWTTECVVAGFRWLVDRPLPSTVAPELVAEVGYERVDGRRFRHPARSSRRRRPGSPSCCREPDGRGRGAERLADEPRQGALAGDRDDEGGADRVLRRGRAGPAAAPRGQAADAAPLPGRRRRDQLAPERDPTGAGLVPRLRDEQARRPAAALRARGRARVARLGREPGGDRAAPVLVARRASSRADPARLRPRPGAAGGAGRGGAVALALRPSVEELGLEPVPKASGSLGLHVHAAVETGTDTKRLAREVAEALAEERPDEVVAEMKRAARAGRVFVDWLQNDVTRQTVAPYSLRGLPYATVAAPVRWDEVERAAAGDAGALVFTRGGMLERIEGEGDLFEALRRRVALGRSQTPVLVKRNICRKRHNVFRAADSKALLL